MKVKRKRLEKFKLFPLEKAVKLDSFCQFTRSATKKAKWGESIERAKDDIDDSQMMGKKRKRKRNEKCNVIRMQMIESSKLVMNVFAVVVVAVAVVVVLVVAAEAK